MNILRSFSRVIVVGFLVIAAIVVSFATSPAWAANARSTSNGVLSEIEAEWLTHMREEEKVARDVYLLMYETYGAGIFANIASSEQKHMDTMLKKLIKYNLPDPALPTNGDFTNEELQKLYDDLVDLGSVSLVEALKVGALIEETDIVDLQNAIFVTTHVDVVNAYQNLMAGSENHLRAFVGELEAQGITYTPQVISQELFEAIMGE